MPSICPHCQETMEEKIHSLSEYTGLPERTDNGSSAWITRKCLSETHPELRLTSTLDNHNDVMTLILVTEEISFVWNMRFKSLDLLDKKRNSFQECQFFEPVLSDLNVLLKKCKILLTFS